jgi:hypothetical protein
MQIFEGRNIKKAKVLHDTKSFLRKGDIVEVRKYDAKDNTYLCWMRGAGLWLRDDEFEYLEEYKNPFRHT